MAPTPTRVLRFARSDDTSTFVLLQVTPKGSRPLDLKLVGTEGEAPYVASCKSFHSPSSRLMQLKQDRLSSLRVKNCPASEAEWQAILEALLNQEPLADIQATATVQSESSISITVRKEIQGITQRLGAISLRYDADEAIELFDWCGAAVEASAAGKQAVAELTTRSRESETAVVELQTQLEELLRAKDEDETALLRKFRDLLNEKKVKIREQQQVLAKASFNASHPGSQPPPAQSSAQSSAPSAESSKPARKAGRSRATKRKEPASKRVEESEDEAPVAMDVGIKEEPEDTDPGNTTEGTASAGSDTDGDDEDEDEGDVAGAPTTTAETTETTEMPPARRELPFNNKPARATPARAAPAESETDSDDEL